MSGEMYPQVAEVLRQGEQIQSALDEQLQQLDTAQYKGRDEAKTVAVTLDGRQRLTRLSIEDGLLRLGLDEVAQRINQAIHDAQAAATASIDSQQRRFFESMQSATDSLQETLGLTQAESR